MSDWPPDYRAEYQRRQSRLRKLRAKPSLWPVAKLHYASDPVAWINDWCVTYDPRLAGTDSPTTMPFVLFPKQVELVRFLHALVLAEENGLIEKCRDMGATWVCCAFSVWLWIYWPGAAVGWGSRKEQLVDKIGVVDSIFEKMRVIVRNLPREMRPSGFSEADDMTFMRFINRETGATIVGEAGDNIGRGGRTLIYFKDEAAHYERPEKIEAALSDNTRCQVDISSVNGLGNVFHRRRDAAVEWNGGDIHAGKVNCLVMDWRDHPAKDQAWYDGRRAKAESDGLLHIFAQEIDRDYAAAVDGVIIPAAWVSCAIDAHIKLGIEPGKDRAGFDVADEGGDLNALVEGRGVVVSHCETWGGQDVGQSTRRVVDRLSGRDVDLQYDCIGIGAGVKAEANRLRDEGSLPKGVKFTPWNAGAGVLDPDNRLIPGDIESPINKEMFANLKAQAWWQLRMRFERTHKAINEGIEYDHDELISLPSDLPGLHTLRKELSQPVRAKTGALKMVVDKKPEGTRSPNMADALVQMMWPVSRGSTYNIGAF